MATLKSLNRRRFLRTTALGASISALDVGRFAHAAGNDTLRVGLIGCGGRGTGAASQVLRTGAGIKLVAMGDLFEERLKPCLDQIQSKNPGKVDVLRDRQFVGFEAFKMVLESGVDLVILATPPGFRPMHFEATVSAGKHCFLETEVAVDAPGIRQLLKAAEQAKKKSLTAIVGHQSRYHVGYEAMAEKVHAGIIGDINSLEIRRGISKALWHQKRGEIEPKLNHRLTELEYQLRNWINFTWLGGDLVGLLSHKIDICHWLTKSFPHKCTHASSERRLSTSSDFGDRADYFTAEFIYENGLKLISETYTMVGKPDLDTEIVKGKKGSAKCNEFTITDTTGKELWSRKFDVSPYQREQDVFVESIRNNSGINTVEVGANVALTSLMGRTAATLGRAVTRDEVLNSKEALFPDTKLSWDTPPPTLPDKLGDYRFPAKGR